MPCENFARGGARSALAGCAAAPCLYRRTAVSRAVLNTLCAPFTSDSVQGGGAAVQGARARASRRRRARCGGGPRGSTAARKGLVREATARRREFDSAVRATAAFVSAPAWACVARRTTTHGLPWSTRPCTRSSAASAPATVGNCTNAWSLRRPLFISLIATALVTQTLTQQQRRCEGRRGVRDRGCHPRGFFCSHTARAGRWTRPERRPRGRPTSLAAPDS